MNKLLIFIILLLTISPVAASDTQIPTVTASITVADNAATITGTAADTSNDINTTAGIQRVELKLNDQPWVTASGTTTYNYTFNNLKNGNHVVAVRAIDTSNNPSTTTYKIFNIDSETETDINDLSWYISISNARFETVDSVFNIRTVNINKDIKISFDINNDADTERKLRYIITRGSYESSDDVIIKAKSDTEIEEWIVGSVLDVGVNRFKISIDDWETHTTVAEKEITITVENIITIEDEDIPIWFQKVAELNNFSLSGTPVPDEYNEIITRLNTQDEIIKTQQQEIKNLQQSTVQPTAQPDTQKSQVIAGVDNIWLLIATAIGLFFYNKKYPIFKNKQEEYNDEPLVK